MKNFEENVKNEFFELVKVMEKLRSENGCPWDKKQTHRTLIPYLIEECYELVEAIEKDKPEEICEELGDVLLQIVFHAQIARENGDFSIVDVIKGIKEKLIIRHPHVFSTEKVKNAEEVSKNWEKIKKKEKKDRKSILDGIPKNLPALLKAYRVQSRASKVGFDWNDIEGVIDKIKEEIDELKEADNQENKEKIEEEFGDLLFALVNFARFKDIRPEEALQRTVTKFIERFKYIEESAQKSGRNIQDLSLNEMDFFWEKAKQNEKRS